MNIRKFQTEIEFVNAVIEDLTAEDLRYLALSGGSTPGPIYERLSQFIGDTEVFIVDERYTELNSPDSNYRLIREKLYCGEESRHLHFWDTSLDLKKCVEDYREMLSQIPERVFDAVILGIGPDGHFASFFPGCHNKDHLAFHTQTEKFSVRNRLTMSPELILRAKKLIVILKGEQKQAVLHELESGSKSWEEFPAKLLTSHQNLKVFHLI